MPGTLRARNRIAMYLPPSAPPPSPPPAGPRDPAVLLTAAPGVEVAQRGDGGRAVALAALAGERAVAVYDYEWSMQQVET